MITAFHRFNCNTNGKGHPWSESSDSRGTFEVLYEITDPGEEDSLSCFLVEAIPTDTTQYEIPALKEIDPDLREEWPYDTVRVNFTLQGK